MKNRLPSWLHESAHKNMVDSPCREVSEFNDTNSTERQSTSPTLRDKNLVKPFSL